MIQEKKMRWNRDGLNIVGMEFLPDMPGKHPAIIFSHGFTGNYTDSIAFCRAFAEMGYAAYAYSFCGGGRIGQPEGTASDGNTWDMTILTEAADLMTVMDDVKEKDYVDASRLILAGFSQGGFVSGLTAAKRPQEVYKLIMVFPALCIPDHARAGRLAGASYDIHDVPEKIPCAVTVIGRKLHEEVVGMDPIEELAAYTGPVQIIHGTKDSVVDYQYSVQMQERYGVQQSSLLLVEGMDHGFDPEQEKLVLDTMKAFVRK